jgi:hypothetical protein
VANFACFAPLRTLRETGTQIIMIVMMNADWFEVLSPQSVK